jgi:TRAP-type mannitol/chloroaromatic compound transport system substrate-binding protein
MNNKKEIINKARNQRIQKINKYKRTKNQKAKKIRNRKYKFKEKIVLWIKKKEIKNLKFRINFIFQTQFNQPHIHIQ